MRFDLSDEQHEIRRAARELLASGPSWGELCALGWPGIAIDAEQGGQGLGAIELAVLLEEHGYACSRTPLLGTALAALAIQHAGSDAQRARWLPALAGEEAVGALGVAGEPVPDAVGAEVVVLVDPERQEASVVAAADVELVDTIDPTRSYARVSGGDAEPLDGDVAAALDHALIAVSAELVGLSRRALDLSVAYVKDRKQFGAPIGSFQAVKHLAARMLRDTESAAASTLYAAYAADRDRSDRAVAAASAKAVASQAGLDVTGTAIQLHGAAGFTWEADVHFLYKRAHMDAHLLGGAHAHRARIAALVAGARTVATH